MKIILLKDVQKLGKRLDLKKVKPGYARNFLIPQELAIAATKNNLAWREREVQKTRKKIEKFEKEKEALKKKIKDTVLDIQVKTGIKGELFEKITREKIAKSLQTINFDLEKDNVKLEKPIDKLGEYKIKINLGDNVETKVKLVVSEENKKNKKK